MSKRSRIRPREGQVEILLSEPVKISLPVKIKQKISMTWKSWNSKMTLVIQIIIILSENWKFDKHFDRRKPEKCDRVGFCGDIIKRANFSVASFGTHWMSTLDLSRIFEHFNFIQIMQV